MIKGDFVSMDNKLYRLMKWPEIESIVYSECDHPEKVLGCHPVKGGHVITAFFPFAESVSVHIFSKEKNVPMEKVDEEGCFSCFISGKEDLSYEYNIVKKNGVCIVSPEVYKYIPQFWTNLSDKLKAGVFYDSYRYFGAHFCERKGILGTEFMVYAPAAARVSVVGDFNDWDGRVHQMCKIDEFGVFGIFLPGVGVGSLYKFEIKLHNGLTYLKRDPYALSIEKGCNDAGRVIEDPNWEIVKYKRPGFDSNISILNISLHDYLQTLNDKEDIGDKLSATVREFGYDAVLFEDFSTCHDKIVAPTGKISFFAVCPDDLRITKLISLIDKLHENNIRVLSTLNLSGFIPDDCGLKGFDGTGLYEGNEKELNKIITFDFNKPYVRNYLISVCDYFVRTFCLDGLCLSGTDRILYLDFMKKEGEYSTNIYGGCESINGFEFFKHLNSIMHKRYSNVVTIARDSLYSNTLTLPLDEEGLGFDYKIHTEFDKDLFAYLKYPFIKRKLHHSELTYSPVYIHCERFILSYLYPKYGADEEAMLKLFPGTMEEKKKGYRLALSYLFLHPGRKCLPFVNVSEEHKNLICDLISLYKNTTAISGNDDSLDCFEWANAIDSDNSVLSFIRRSGDKEVLVICNFSNADFKYSLNVNPGCYKEIFTSDHLRFGGNARLASKAKNALPSNKDRRTYSLSLNLAALSLHVYEKMPCQNHDIPL